MKRLSARVCLALTMIGLATATTAAAAEPAPDQLETDLGKLEEVANGYPPRLATPEDRARIEALWHSVEARLLQAPPHEFETELRLGNLYRMGHNLDVEGVWDKAVAHLTEAARLRPDSPLPPMLLGEHYVGSGHPAEAEPQLLRALSLNGKPSTNLSFYLAFTYYQLGQYEKVIPYANEYLKGDPDSPAMKLFKERSEAVLRGEPAPKTITIEPKPPEEAVEKPASVQEIQKNLVLATPSFQRYYLSPRPDTIPSLIAEMQKQGMLALGHMTAAGFLSQVFHDNPDRLKDWAPLIWQLDDPAREYLWLAVWFAGTEPALDLLREAGRREKGKVAESIAPIATGTVKAPIPLSQIEVKSGQHLDLLWGAFYATGRQEYIAKIIKCLPWSLKSKPEDTQEKAIGLTAEWSLRQNARNHPRVLAICKSELARSEGETREILSKLILDAEKGGSKRNDRGI